MLSAALEGPMFRALFKVVLILVVLAAAVAFFMGYRLGDHGVDRTSGAVGTTGSSPSIDTTRAREAGAKVGEKVATGANQAERALETGALTAKIKAKMALDDTVKALDINVDTTGTVVTLTGTVHSQAERSRALQLARETAGVTSVTDHITVR
jgi:hyperosmotically inducible periplasmic protein